MNFSAMWKILNSVNMMFFEKSLGGFCGAVGIKLDVMTTGTGEYVKL
jgi:hypothetical protein